MMSQIDLHKLAGVIFGLKTALYYVMKFIQVID